MGGIAAGRLRHRVTFEGPEETQDPTTGEVIVAWSPLFTDLPAEVEERQVSENVGGGQLQVTTRVTVTVRWRPGFNAKQRIVWASPSGERVFNISGLVVDTATARTWIEIPVVELI